MKNNENEILEEIWKTRREIEAESGNDLHLVFKKMKKKSAKSNRKHYSGRIRKIKKQVLS